MEADDSCAPPEDRQAKIDDAQKVNFGLSGLAIVAAVCFWAGKGGLHLLAAIVLAVLPVALIYLVRREPLVYALLKRKGDPRTDLGIGFMACGFGLIFGNGDIHFVSTTMLFECAGLVGLLVCAAVFSAARKNPAVWNAMIGTLIFAGIYGWGVTAAVDSLADRSAPVHYTTTVTNMYESHGGRGGTHYHLALAPWGPMQDGDDLTVPGMTYGSTAIGQQVCLELHPGLLYVKWYRVVACDNSGQ
jgi:hypothetical protein